MPYPAHIALSTNICGKLAHWLDSVSFSLPSLPAVLGQGLTSPPKSSLNAQSRAPNMVGV